MADETAPAAVSQSPVAATQPAAAPEMAAAPAAFSEPVVAETTVIQPEVTQVEPAPEPVQTSDSFLSDAGIQEAVTETVKPEQPVDNVSIAYEPFTLPEGVKLDDARIGEFTKLLGEFETTTKADHTALQQFGQKLVDLYLNEAKQISAKQTEVQQAAWKATQDAWQEQFKSDPELGGNRQETTRRQAGAVLERYGSQMGRQREADLRMALRVTGAGNHPEVIRFVNWMSSFATERARPVPAIVPKSPVPQSRAARRYGSSGNGAT